jgi:hypothetical protein
MYRKKKRNIYLAILTLITIVLWVGFDVVRAYSASNVTPDVTRAMTPLDPRVDQRVFEELERRHNLVNVTTQDK